MIYLALEKSAPPKAPVCKPHGRPHPGKPGTAHRRSRARSCRPIRPPRTGDHQRAAVGREGVCEGGVVVLGGIYGDEQPTAIEDQRQALGVVELSLEPFAERRVLPARE
jgi:hypothetical protein